MSISKILFSFSGRIPRQTYWLAHLGIWASVIAFAMILGIIGALFGTRAHSSGFPVMVLTVPMYLCVLWCSLAVTVKRWHDHGKSGLWMLISFVPFIGPFWALAELGFLEGTQGPNKFDDGIFSGDSALAVDDPLFSTPPIAGRQCVYCQQTIVSFIGAELCGECNEPAHVGCTREHVASAHRSPAVAAYS